MEEAAAAANAMQDQAGMLTESVAVFQLEHTGMDSRPLLLR
jgi:hypothetical protein